MKVGELNALIKLEGKNQFDRDVDGAGRKFSSLGDTALRAGQAMATTLVGAGTAMVGLGAAAFKTGVNYNALQQSSRAALTTLLGSAEAANAQMDKLDDFASNSPFAKDVFIRAQQQLIGFGVAAEDVIPILGAVQDATAAVGGSNQEITEIVNTLAKISSTGKITAQDLNELGNRGIDAAQLMGDEFGKTSAEIRDDISNSRISAEDAINAIVNQMGVKFGGAAADVKETWDGATDRVKAAWRDIGSELAAPFVDPNGGGRAVQWVNDLADVMRALQAQVAPLMDVVMTRWAGQFDRITPYLQDLKDRIDSIDMSNLNESLDALDGYGGIIAGLAGAFAAWGTAALPIIGGINPIVAGVTALVLATPELRDGLDGVLGAAMPLVTEFGELGVQIADIAVKVLTEFAPAFFDLAEAVINAATPLAGPMVDAISGLLALADPFIDLLSGIVSWMAELPDGVLLAGTAFLMLKDNMGPLTGVVDSVRGAFDNFQLHRHVTSMEGFTTAVGKAGTALKTAFMANAPALAIAGIVTVIGKIAGASSAAEDRIKALSDAFEEVGDTSEKVRDQIYQNLLADENYFGFGKNVVDRFEDAGIEIGKVIDAILGDAEAFGDVTAELEALADAAYAAGDPNLARRYLDLIDVMVKQQENVGAATDEYVRHQEATADTSGTEEAISAAERLTDVIGDEVEAIQTLIDKRREERGEALTLAETQIADAQAREQMLAVMEKEGNLLDENGDKFDAYSEKGQYAIEATRGVSDSMEKSAQSMALAGEKIPEITAALEDQYDAWIETATAMGIPEEKAHELAETYGLIPSEIATDAYLEATGVMETLEDIEFEINETTGEITILGNPAEAQQTLAEIIGDVNDADGTVEINGNPYPGWLTLEQYLNEINESEEDATINADKQKGSRVLRGFEGDVRGMEEFAKINATDDRAMHVLTGAETKIKNTQANMKIGANTAPLDNWAARAAGSILGTAYVNVRPNVDSRLYNTWQADGSVLDFYAQGGVRENHVAQIAPPGAWRVWAEPETGGEAYIPLALAKRSRSEAILAEVADRFGMMLIDAPRFYADGGMSQTAPRSAPVTRASGDGLPRHVVLQIGDREISGLIREVAGEHPGVKAANEFVTTAARYQKAGY